MPDQNKVKRASNEQITKNLLEEIKKENSTQEKTNLIKNLHYTLGHPGIRVLCSFLKLSIENTCYKIVKSITSTCHKCLMNKHHGWSPYETNGNLISTFPNSRVTTDICGPYTTEINDKRTRIYIINFIDNLTGLQ